MAWTCKGGMAGAWAELPGRGTERASDAEKGSDSGAVGWADTLLVVYVSHRSASHLAALTNSLGRGETHVAPNPPFLPVSP